MRLSAFVFAVCALVFTASATAQTYSSGTSRPAGSALRPAETVGWRNYVAVPDGPCGPPMSVETDTYEVCRPCGPLHPICFLHRVGRMLNCLLPCNMCCHGGGGLFHGCILGGRSWGCDVCCGGQACRPNPCGSAFAPCCGAPSCAMGAPCQSCSSTVPALRDPFQDDPLPPTSTAYPAEVRRGAKYKNQAAVSRLQVKPAVVQRTSPYKIVSPPADVLVQPIPSTPSDSMSGSGGRSRQAGVPTSVLRRASANDRAEPRHFPMDDRGALPIIRSQSPDDESDEAIPYNPLRKK